MVKSAKNPTRSSRGPSYKGHPPRAPFPAVGNSVGFDLPLVIQSVKDWSLLSLHLTVRILSVKLGQYHERHNTRGTQRRLALGQLGKCHPVPTMT